jgi:hypothetical protein
MGRSPAPAPSDSASTSPSASDGPSAAQTRRARDGRSPRPGDTRRSSPPNERPSEQPAANRASEAPALASPPLDASTPPAAGSTPAESAAASASPSAAASDAPREPGTGPLLQSLEPERNEATDPVLDWRVAWTDDGTAFGYWIAETTGSSWGRLSVRATEGSPDGAATQGRLLGPTLARRAFTLGRDRIAWVAPVDEDPEGELRVRTWGENGDGGVRLRGIDVDQGLPGF